MQLKERIMGAILGMAVADALAMPSHWFYDRSYLKKVYGTITKFLDAPQFLPNSILNLSNTGGPGRGPFTGDLVGTTILHGKKKYWARGQSIHYHWGLKAGENTLDLQVMRLLLRSVAKQGGFKKMAFLQDYVKFMTTPDTFKDIYAGSAHRLFFKNMVQGKKLEECAGNDGHNVDGMDGLTNVPPLIFLHLGRESKIEDVKLTLTDGIKATRNSDVLVECGLLLYDLFKGLKQGKSLTEVVQEQAKKMGIKLSKDGRDPMVACYVGQNYVSMLHFLYKYTDPVEGLLANANAGGQNVARGAILGALYGFAWGKQGLGKFPRELAEGKEIEGEVLGFLQAVAQ